MENNLNNTPSVSPELERSVARSRGAWRALLARMKSMTPSLVARTLLGLGALISLVWLVRTTWPAVLPFAFGAAVAYMVLPLVNWMDRFLPRVFAIIITLTGVVGLLGWFLWMLIPLLNAQITRVYVLLPPIDEVQAYILDMAEYVDTLPEPAQVLVNDFLQEFNVRVQESAHLYASRLANVGLTNFLNLVNTIGFVLGFLVVPGWLLTVLKDQKNGQRAINQLVPRFMRKDFWATVRIIDRPFRSFLHGQVLLGLSTTLAVYAILWFLEYIGLRTFNYKLVLALLAGFFALIPEVGVIFAVIVFFLLGLLQSLELALLAITIYLSAYQIVKLTVGSRIEKRYLNIHPAVLVIAIVILSEFGLLWILVAAPLTAVIRDLYQYVYGRLNDPPRPAGVLPSEPIPILTAAPRRRRRDAKPEVPVAYRHGRAERRPR